MEKLNNKNDIEIKLLANRRFIYSNRQSNIVITAENNATEIAVSFPEEYEEYSKRVDFVNSQGKAWTEGLYIPEYKEYPAVFSKTHFTFTLPNEVTTVGEMKMQFMAYMPDNSMTTVPFEIVPIYVNDGITVFKKGGKNNPDLLILSYNQSAEALFNSQQAKAKANEADTQASAAADMAKTAQTVANEAVAISKDARKTAKSAVDKAETAIVISKTAENTATQAVNTADASNITATDAKSTAERSLNTSNYAANRANEAFDAALTAERNSNRALTESTAAMQFASAAETKAAKAEAGAAQAGQFATCSNEKSDKAILAAQSALSTAKAAYAKSDIAMVDAGLALNKSNKALAVSESVAQRADNGDFKGDKGNKGEKGDIGAQGVKGDIGEQGVKGDKGDKGEIGESGKDGVAFITDNLVGFHVNEDGNFYAYAGETAGPGFRYDEITGELYLVYQ